jgi:Zn-dependent peptidase ImmA (M78 family)
LAAELSDELESPFSPPSGTVKMTRVDPEDLAEQQRRLPGLAVGEQVQIESPYAAFRVWREAVEARDILVLGFPLPSKEVRAFSLADDQVPVIVVNSNDTITARIFSLFHEYAHVLIGHLGLCLPEQHFQRSKRASPTEVFCNHFAGALLVPRSALLAANAQRDPKLADEKFAIRMSRVFHVSRQVIARRMLITDLISKEKHNDLVAQWGWYASPERPPRKSKSGYAQPEHLTCLRRRGTRFASLVMEARQRGLLLDSQVAEYLDIRTGSLDRVEALLASA